MATLKELRIRVASLKNTRKITSAMKMVSASKLKRAKDAWSRTQVYFDKMTELLNRLSLSVEDVKHPLMEPREICKTRFILLTSDRGLCGGFNNNLLKFFYTVTKDRETDFEIEIIGKKANDSLSKQNLNVTRFYQDMGLRADYQNARLIASSAINDFLSHGIDQVILIYNKFISTLTQRPIMSEIIPFKHISSQEDNPSSAIDYIFEPSCDVLLKELLPRQISNQIFQAMLNNAVGEHAARMTAMDNASNNAGDFISSLTVKMNRARQAAITTELIEIISGAEAV